MTVIRAVTVFPSNIEAILAREERLDELDVVVEPGRSQGKAKRVLDLRPRD